MDNNVDNIENNKVGKYGNFFCKRTIDLVHTECMDDYDEDMSVNDTKLTLKPDDVKQ